MKYIFIIYLSLLITISYAQNGAIPPVIRAQNTLDDISRSGVGANTLLYGLPMRPGTLIGDFYLDNKWNRSTLLLYAGDKLLEGYLTRFDLKEQHLEIKLDKSIKILDIRKIRSIVWRDSLTNKISYYVNAGDFVSHETKLLGLLEVLVDGKLPLMKHTSVAIKRADYNVALDVGSKDDRVLKKEILYFSRESSLYEIKNKKSLGSAFLDRQEQVDVFIRNNKLSFSNERDLITLFEYYNSLEEK